MIAGVAGGVGRWLGVDPVVVRVVLVVLALFGGSGLVLYALGWLFVPEEGDATSAAQQLADRAGRPGSGSRTALIVAAVVIGVIVLSGLSSSGPWGFWGKGSALLLVLAGALVLYLLNRPPVPAGTLPPAPPPTWPPAGPSGPSGAATVAFPAAPADTVAYPGSSTAGSGASPAPARPTARRTRTHRPPAPWRT